MTVTVQGFINKDKKPLSFARVMAVFLYVLVATLPAHTAELAKSTDSLLSLLDNEIRLSGSLIDNKEKYISGLRQRLIAERDSGARFSLYRDLYSEYKVFQFDSAYSYAIRMYQTALGDTAQRARLTLARIALMECYNSVGLFKEADDMLRAISVNTIPPEELAAFYSICMCYYRNMSSYAGASSPLGRAYADSLALYAEKTYEAAPVGSFDRRHAEISIMELRGVPVSELAKAYAALPGEFSLDDHTLAVVHSEAGRSYWVAGDIGNAIRHLAISAIHDIRSCTRETTAAKDLAQLMHGAGQLERANRYIHYALEDAKAFNSRLRQKEINNVLPIIETTRYGRVSARVSLLVAIVIVIVGLLILSLWLFFKLRRRNRSLAESHEEIRRKTVELARSNEALSDLNRQLRETGEIKDRYIIQSLIGNTDFVGEIEGKMKRALTKLKGRQYDEVARILQQAGTKDERERMYTSFDSAFLKLFPNFPEEFNALFPEGERHEIDEEHGLPTDVRIYALMRLGIENVAEVARYLNLSVNTVYVYKTRLKSRSSVGKDDFDKLVMSIPKP